MRLFSRTLLALGVCLAIGAQAMAASVVTLIFSGNDWGYIRPCPT